MAARADATCASAPSRGKSNCRVLLRQKCRITWLVSCNHLNSAGLASLAFDKCAIQRRRGCLYCMDASSSGCLRSCMAQFPRSTRAMARRVAVGVRRLLSRLGRKVATIVRHFLGRCGCAAPDVERRRRSSLQSRGRGRAGLRRTSSCGELGIRVSKMYSQGLEHPRHRSHQTSYIYHSL